MTLQPVRLDDLTWEEMVAAILRRIPAESQGIWTLYAPVDPGVTLLELFAALLEQRLYWLDQIPDALVVGVFRLLGVQPPKPAVPAATVLQIKIDPHGRPFVIPAGTVFTRDLHREIVFTTDQDVTVLPFSTDVRGGTVGLHTGGEDRTADLRARRGVPLLPIGGGPGEARITLNLTAPVPDGWLSLLVDLLTEGIPPSWAADAAVGVPPPAEVTWSYEGPGKTAFDPSDIEDGTQGLRRSGIVRLRIPRAWSAAGARSLELVLNATKATFAFPPRLLRLEPNVVAARHRQSITPDADELDELVRKVLDWLPLPGRELELPEAAGRLLSAKFALRDRTVDQPVPWHATDDLAFHGREDRVFVVDRDAGSLRFGDGRTGRIPVPDRRAWGEPLLEASWEVGGGADGNGGMTDNWRGNGFEAANIIAAAGGEDAETIARARTRAAAELRKRRRAVTAQDYETIARETPGVAVARAYAAVGDHPGFPCDPVPGAVSVYVVPDAPRGEDDWDRPDFIRAPRPDPGTMKAVRRQLGEARLLGTELFAREPRYRRARLRVDVAGAPGDPAAVRRRLQAALGRYLDPLTGGDSGDGWPFGAPLRPSALLRVAQKAAGADGEVVAVAITIDGTPDSPNCRDVPIGPNELVELQDVRVQFAPGTTFSEGLQ